MIEPEVKVRYLRPFRNKRRGAEGMLPETQAIELAFAKILVIVHDEPVMDSIAPPDADDVEVVLQPEPSWPAAAE